MKRQRLLELAARASTLDERLAAKLPAATDASSQIVIDERLLAWRSVTADGDQARFERRLAWDGISIEAATSALGPASPEPDQALPPWCAMVGMVVAAAKSLCARDSFRRIDIAEPVPFAELLEPLLVVGRERLVRHLGDRHAELFAPLSPEARDDLDRALLHRLHAIGGRTLFYEFDNFRAMQSTRDGCFQAFVTGLLCDGLERLLCEFPVLARLWVLAVDLWVNSSAELLTRLAADAPLLARTFALPSPPRVASLSSSMSDSHDGGRTVMGVAFEGGRRVIYKPRSLALEVGFGVLLDWCNARNPSLDLRGPRLLDRSTHGWAEWIEAAPCRSREEVARFYRRAGALLALAHVFDATDLHWENLVAAGEHPILIDVETLLHPQSRPLREARGSSAEHAASQQLKRSVLATSLLPSWRSHDGGIRYDNSGLGGVGDAKTMTKQRMWVEVNRDHMTRITVSEPLPANKNRVLCDGVVAHPTEHRDEVDRGFSDMYRFVSEKRDALLATEGPLRALESCAGRFVFRHTSVYVNLQQRALHPELLRDGADRSLAFEALGRAHTSVDARPAIWPLFAVERRALEQLEAPRFAVSTSKDELVIEGAPLAGYFERSSIEALRRRIASTSEADLTFQRFVIRASLSPPTASPSDPPPANGEAPPLDDRALIEAARSIAELLASQAVRGADGSATWLGLRAVPLERRYQIDPIGLSLGDGAAGALLFLAALEHAGGGNATTRALLDGVHRHITRQLDDERTLRTIEPLGGLVGRTSIVYALTRAGLLLADASLVDEAMRLVQGIDASAVAADRTLDLVGGAAGSLLALLPLIGATRDRRAVALATACGEHLVAQRVPSGNGQRAWPTVAGRFLTGISHGTAGIALALARGAVALSSPALLDAAEEALLHETALFDPVARNWPDLRPVVEEPFACSWCHGAPGIAVARASLLPMLDTPAVRSDIDAALATTRAYDRDPIDRIDHLCCGSFGRAEVLHEVGLRLDRIDLVHDARARLERLAAQAKSRGGFAVHAGPLALAPSPGLWQGLSGIGYALLRAAAPTRLPSILTLA